MNGADAIVVGAGVVGASVAFHLAEKGMDTLILDREGPAAGSTARSGALIRAHYPTPLEADLTWESLTDYFQPWGERVGGGRGFTCTGFATLVGSRDSLQWLQSPDEPTPESDGAFIENASRRLGRRIPVLADAPYRSGRSGILDMTPDGRPILGPAGADGLYLAAGWSGTGFKKSPAVGAEVARWISDGAPKRAELQSYHLARFEEGALIQGQ